MSPAKWKNLEEKTRARWARMIAALLVCRSHAEACKQARVATSTLATWLNDPRFMQEYRQAKRTLYERAVGKLPAIADEAVEKLRDILSNPNTTVRERLTAIRICLEFSQGALTGDMEQLRDELEALLQKHNRKGRRRP